MYKKIGCILLLLLWMGVIFAFSAQPAKESTVSSDKVEGVVLSVLKIFFPELAETEFAENLTTIVRKSAHVVLYMILSMLVLLALSSFCIKQHAWFYAWCFSMLYAVSDEIHQIFVEGRAGRFSDILIDSIGVTIGVTVWFLFANSKSKNSKKLIDK